MKFSNLLQMIFIGLACSALLLSCKKAPSPAGPLATTALAHGEAVLKAQCLTCHGMDMIASQRLSKTGWTKEVEKMVRWGATVPDADKESLVEFLSVNYPVRAFTKEPPSPPVPAVDASVIARGKVIHQTKCLTCHGEELSMQQHLSKAGWTKEVEKMVRWGATVSDDEKAALVEYLVTQNRPAKK